jgi:hypothetical protein
MPVALLHRALQAVMVCHWHWRCRLGRCVPYPPSCTQRDEASGEDAAVIDLRLTTRSNKTECETDNPRPRRAASSFMRLDADR